MRNILPSDPGVPCGPGAPGRPGGPGFPGSPGAQSNLLETPASPGNPGGPGIPGGPGVPPCLQEILRMEITSVLKSNTFYRDHRSAHLKENGWNYLTSHLVKQARQRKIKTCGLTSMWALTVKLTEG